MLNEPANGLSDDRISGRRSERPSTEKVRHPSFPGPPPEELHQGRHRRAATDLAASRNTGNRKGGFRK